MQDQIPKPNSSVIMTNFRTTSKAMEESYDELLSKNEALEESYDELLSKNEALEEEVTKLKEELRMFKSEVSKKSALERIQKLSTDNADIDKALVLIDELGADVFKRTINEHGLTLIKTYISTYLICESGRSRASIDSIRKLVEAGADVHFSDGRALINFISRQSHQCAKYLLECGADINCNSSSMIKSFSTKENVFFLLDNDAIIPKGLIGNIQKRLPEQDVYAVYNANLNITISSVIKVITRLSYNTSQSYVEFVSKISEEDLGKLSGDELSDLMKPISKSNLGNKKEVLEKVSGAFLKRF